MKNITRLIRTTGSAGAHRINVGLTLLALIFLTVLVAAAGVRATRTKASVIPRGETLAVLGVAPGSGGAAQLSPSLAAREMHRQ